MVICYKHLYWWKKGLKNQKMTMRYKAETDDLGAAVTELRTMQGRQNNRRPQSQGSYNGITIGHYSREGWSRNNQSSQQSGRQRTGNRHSPNKGRHQAWVLHISKQSGSSDWKTTYHDASERGCSPIILDSGAFEHVDNNQRCRPDILNIKSLAVELSNGATVTEHRRSYDRTDMGVMTLRLCRAHLLPEFKLNPSHVLNSMNEVCQLFLN